MSFAAIQRTRLTYLFYSGPWLGLETASIVCYAVGGVSFFLAATGLLLRPRDYDWAGEPKWIARRVYLEFLSGLAWIGNGVLMMQPHGVEKDYYDPNGVEAPTVGWYGVVGMSFMMGYVFTSSSHLLSPRFSS